MNTTMKTLSTALFALFTAACDESAMPESADAVALRDGSIDPCERLSLDAVDAILAELDDAVALAEANAEAITGDVYPQATQLAIDYLGDAQEMLVTHRAWLVDNNVAIDSQIGSYNTHAVAREASYQAAHGHYWAAISAIYNHTAEARLASERGIVAQAAMTPLAADGLLCFTRISLGE